MSQRRKDAANINLKTALRYNIFGIKFARRNSAGGEYCLRPLWRNAVCRSRWESVSEDAAGISFADQLLSAKDLRVWGAEQAASSFPGA